MFKKILIANRSEIAIRIHDTASRMGIQTVAVYSDADKYSRHTMVCDEAVRIGPAPAAESYLAIDNIVAACKKTGADAVHPGYGFLAENAAFARRLRDEGIAFIGPAPDVIAAMGDKIQANRTALEAGLPTVPGHWDPIPDAATAVQIANSIGLPVMLKAAAGGGGKGIRVARTVEQVEEGFRVATSEARSSFADDRIFIEKFIEEPRHIEIQVLGDQQGHVIHLGERECSIQRRHQKVIEEAPSPFIDPETREAMGSAAVTLARSVGFTTAGTVEFIVDQKRNFYFLEMNTRLQVEHAVTEFITGLDIVEWMIRISNGEPLAFSQEEISFRGWAVEARVYAEDPNRGFLPSTGRLVRYRTPTVEPDIRVDNGVYEGGEITRFYDPMIAKVTTWDLDRDSVIARMRRALDEFYIQGVNHNIAFLTALLAHPRFLEGRLSTHFIADEYPEGFSPAPLEARDLNAIIGAAALMHLRYMLRAARTSGQMPGYQFRIPEHWEVRVNDTYYAVTIQSMPEGFDVTRDDGHVLAVRSDWQIGDPVLRCTINAHPERFKVERDGLGYILFHQGAEVRVEVYPRSAARLAKLMPVKVPPDMSMYLLSPMPGLLRSVAVEEGEEVVPGKELCVVEAMKMENILRSERVVKIANIRVRPGDTLTVGQVILEFASASAKPVPN
ncbi:MAG: acetyl-CoA carboxylase biotin carboxylase subunit [Gammaproteobacteria bacterium]